MTKTIKVKKSALIDIIKYPILTDKTTQMIEENKYSFAVEVKAKKPKIKEAIEQLFDVKVQQINTLIVKPQKKRVGKYIGYKSKYKKAVIKLYDPYKINLFADN
uniref:Large ribosomal subunit protein uL23c n=1 Tax=Gracilaria tenuistipitata var. liui TaxID=285951 RepID=RK23_GRATL|nr:50S ribosomal protein L23 [Gracilaria tenuistipitata var. liui]Q6B8V5.1 RecName: Full=Large ribosomal subunit protein uL23c; AltName: Full=50S ribosomal protein L23, chloroplastic [Gracilaria tenuistipitata var. liui]AAT79680.1 50S ribosomal protein L23 [Gracilaria tenuistipitata var. liui]